jgi:hypothetical protein
MQVASNPGPAQGFPKGRARIAPVGRTPQPAQVGRGEMAILKKQAAAWMARPGVPSVTRTSSFKIEDLSLGPWEV